MKTSHLPIIFLLVLWGVSLTSFLVFQDQKKREPWTIPAEYKTKKMAEASDENQGKMLWAVHCKSCHGNVGLGDGPKSANLKTFPGIFKSPEFQSQTDGAIYYESFIGRGEMPNFEKKIPDEEDRWNIVSYIRKLK